MKETIKLGEKQGYQSPFCLYHNFYFQVPFDYLKFFLTQIKVQRPIYQIESLQIDLMRLLKTLASAYSKTTAKSTTLAKQAKIQLRGKFLQGKCQHIKRWQTKLAKKSRLSTARIVPQIQALRLHIKNDPVALMYFQGGLDQIPQYVEQFLVDEDGVEHPQKKREAYSYGYTWEQVLDQWAVITYSAPEYEDADIVGVPFYALVIDLLNTDFGRTFFAMDQIDKHLKNIFNAYGRFLDSPESLQYLTTETNGWLSSDRIDYDDFVGIDKTDKHYGFKSWHGWFTREIKEQRRLFDASLTNQIINNSEYYPNFNMPYKNVQWHDKFWLKDQRYSLAEMFGVSHLPLADQAYFRNEFQGGSVFQGFLNPWCYHRWRAPVGGVLEKAYSVGNSYYAGNPNLDFNLMESYIASQPLLTMTSVRQIYVIETGNPLIGKVAIIEVGMAEVSGIKSVVSAGTKINKGDLLGWFRFGGSSHAIIFSNKARNLKFADSIYERKLNTETGVQDSVKQYVRTPLADVS